MWDYKETFHSRICIYLYKTFISLEGREWLQSIFSESISHWVYCILCQPKLLWSPKKVKEKCIVTSTNILSPGYLMSSWKCYNSRGYLRARILFHSSSLLQHLSTASAWHIINIQWISDEWMTGYTDYRLQRTDIAILYSLDTVWEEEKQECLKNSRPLLV